MRDCKIIVNLSILVIVALTGCRKSHTQLSDNQTFQEIFTEAEIRDLQLLFDFFNQSICSDYSTNTDLDACYKEFLQRINDGFQNGELDFHIPFEEQEKVNDKLSDSTFNKIWGFGWVTFSKTRQDTFKNLHFNTGGKYWEFLKEVSKDNSFIKDYYTTYETVGDIAPSVIAGLVVNYNKLDVKDIRVKFFIAIHYLTLNDKYYREERY